MGFNAKTSEEKDHATYSASGAERWLNCPGSLKLSENAPEQRESEYAREGTDAHACLEFLLNNRTDLKAATKSAAKKYDADMIEHATFAVDWVEEQLKLYPGAELLAETKVDSSPFTCDGQFGTLDVAIVQEFGRLIVVDYKYGAGYAVDPEGADGRGNPQLVYYALGLSYLYNHNFSEVELVVVQPRAYHASGDVVRSFVLSVTDLLAWRPVFFNGVKASKLARPPTASGPWCRWCPAATICPELKDKALRQAQIVFSDVDGIQSMPEPTMVLVPELGTILDACDRLEDWIAKVREHATHVLERGGDIAGFKLVAKRSPRKWVDEERIGKEARTKFGDAAFTVPRLLSPNQLEVTAKKSTPGVNEWVAARTTSESSGTTLVRDSDKRPAVRPLEKIFADVIEVKALPTALQGKLVAKKGRK